MSVVSRLTESGVFRGYFHGGGGVSDVDLLQNNRELVKIPTDVPDEQLILSFASFCFFKASF